MEKKTKNVENMKLVTLQTKIDKCTVNKEKEKNMLIKRIKKLKDKVKKKLDHY